MPAQELITEIKITPADTPIDVLRYTTYPTTILFKPKAKCVINFRNSSYVVGANQEAIIKAEGVTLK